MEKEARWACDDDFPVCHALPVLGPLDPDLCNILSGLPSSPDPINDLECDAFLSLPGMLLYPLVHAVHCCFRAYLPTDIIIF